MAEFRSEAEVIIVAASRDQADILRRQAEQLVKRSGTPEGKFGWRIGDDVFEVKSGYREIRLGEGRMRVLAADAATGDGTIPTLALVDELHRHRSLDLYGVLADGLDAPAPNIPGAGGSLAGFESFCLNLRVETGEPLVLEAHEKRLLRLYFKGFREIVVLLSKKNGKTTLMSALSLYHLKVGATKRQIITISTAGIDLESPLGELRARAHALDNFTRKGVVNTAHEGGFAWLEWCLDEEDDRTDMNLVKKANPASWHTVESLTRRFESPSMTPGRWARFACGVWTGAEEPWLEAGIWDALEVDIGGVTEKEPVWAAVSTGTNPAIVLAAPREGEAAAVKSFIWDGVVALEVLENWLIGLTDSFDLREVAYDRVEFQRSAELLEARGLPMVEIPHSPERLSIVSQTLHRLISQGDLHHDGDPVLRSQVTQAVTKETERGWRLLKSQNSRGLVAMAMAVHQATQVKRPERPPRIYSLTEVS